MNPAVTRLAVSAIDRDRRDYDRGVFATSVRRIAASRRLGRVFHEPIDVVPSTIILAISALQLALFATVHDPMHLLAAVVVLFPFQLNFAGMCHNHHHLNTFRHRLPNRIFEIAMFFQYGMLPYGYTLHHNIGHHGHYFEQTIDSNRWRRADGTTMGPWEFAWKLCLDMYPTVWRIGRHHPTVFRKFRRMALVCAGIFAALLAIDPVNTALLFVLPLPVALLLQAQATYHQHAGLESRDPLHASRSDVDPLYNLRTLNLGFHTAHHLQPSLHWSKLPALHAEIAAHIPPHLVG